MLYEVIDIMIHRSVIIPTWKEGTCHVWSDCDDRPTYFERFRQETSLQDATEKAIGCSRLLVDQLLAQTRRFDAHVTRITKKIS